jgi:hypothetical protein
MTYPDVPPSEAVFLPGIIDRQVVIPLAPVTSEDVLNPVNLPDPNRGTEFGGVGGIVQPPPHVPTAKERMRQIYLIDPTDPGTEPGSVVAPELEGDYPSRAY